MLRALLATAVVAFGFGAARAEDKPVTLTGTMVCSSCALNEPGKCTNVLQVKAGDKLVNYYLADKGTGEPYHEDVCGGGKVEKVTVVGMVTEKDGKKWVKATKVELPK